jgi:hypothetical protein
MQGKFNETSRFERWLMKPDLGQSSRHISWQAHHQKLCSGCRLLGKYLDLFHLKFTAAPACLTTAAARIRWRSVIIVS